MEISVIIPTHNPDAGRLRRVLRALRDQTLPARCWETLLVDNASSPAVSLEPLTHDGPENVRLVAEPLAGLTHARRRGFTAAHAAVCVLVDDDNLLAPDYLACALEFFRAHPQVGAIGGRSLPEFERSPARWQNEFLPLLALRDFGSAVKMSTGSRSAGDSDVTYPEFAPIGAGMAIRRELALRWCESSDFGAICDRRGDELSSSGDNDLVFSVMRAGAEVAYVPGLELIHLIPAARLETKYLGRLNRGIQKSWMRVLSRHDANPWPPIAPGTLRLRQAKAWFTHGAWTGPAGWIRWQGACGHFEGRLATGDRDAHNPTGASATGNDVQQPRPHPAAECLSRTP